MKLPLHWPARTCFTTTLLFISLPIPAQQPAPPAAIQRSPASGSFRFAGRVVSTLDGHPLPHAAVSLSAIPSGAPIASIVSGETGDFAFDHLGPGKYTLQGEAQGYLPSNYEQHEQFSTAIVAGKGIDAESLVFRLQPTAALAGKVIDEAGEPVRQAQVTLYREAHGSGRTEIVQARTAQTNDRGEYSMGLLREGTCFLAVKAIPWYATHPQSPATSREQGEAPILTGVDENLDVAYPITFYPGVQDSAAAAPILLKGGTELHIDLHLSPVKAARLTIHATPTNGGVSYPQLRTPVFGGFDVMMGQMQTAGQGTMEMVGLPPGRYLMQQTDPKTGIASGINTVDLTGGSADVEAFTAASPATLKVTVEDVTGAKLPPNVSVVLRGSDQRDANAQIADDKGETTFTARPQEYRLSVYGPNRPYQVLGIRGADRKLPKDHILLQSGEAADIKLRVATVAAAVEGLATLHGKPAPGAMIVLVPVDATDDAELFRRDQSDLDGTFTLPAVAAGRYIVIAIDDGWKLEWGKPDVLAPYLLHGIPLEIPSTERGSVQLPDAIAVQSRLP